MERVLVTGVAGFIGFHCVQRLLDEGVQVVGVDNVNDYYDVNLKRARLARLTRRSAFTFHEIDIADRASLERAFLARGDEKSDGVGSGIGKRGDAGSRDGAGPASCEAVLHLAAQAGVRYSLENPHAYVDANLVGFVNILELCRHHGVRHLAYASSSSVYGANRKVPFCESDPVDHPISLYAATKKANELMAHTYSHLFRLPTTGLRFFTVYGPWGRPDMALFRFVRAILAGEKLPVYNHGKMRRDFTYVDDVVTGTLAALRNVPQSGTPGAPTDAPYRIYNIGNNQPVELLEFIGAIERAVGKPAQLELLPMQPGDVPETYADCSALERDVGFRPATPVEEGVRRFVEWYREFYGV